MNPTSLEALRTSVICVWDLEITSAYCQGQVHSMSRRIAAVLAVKEEQKILPVSLCLC